MPRRFFKQLLPSPSRFKEHKRLGFLGNRLHDPNLWHISRRSLSGGLALGLFLAYIPLPGQMLMAATVAVLLRVNLPISVAAVWISNPLTIPPMFYLAYRVGLLILGVQDPGFRPELTLASLTEGTREIVLPLMVGSVILGTLSAAFGYLLIQGFWRWHIVRDREFRRERRRQVARRK